MLSGRVLFSSVGMLGDLSGVNMVMVDLFPQELHIVSSRNDGNIVSLNLVDFI